MGLSHITATGDMQLPLLKDRRRRQYRASSRNPAGFVRLSGLARSKMSRAISYLRDHSNPSKATMSRLFTLFAGHEQALRNHSPD